jgi:probable rRNA maturation factor
MRRTGRLTDRPHIEVHNRQRKVQIDVVLLQEFAERALRLCLAISARGRKQLSQLPEIFILIISDRRMAQLHERFLEQPGPTDVITFQHGEIFVGAETARRQAGQFGNSVLRELQLYIVHGFLHLQGFDDRNKADARSMKAAQERILKAALR